MDDINITSKETSNLAEAFKNIGKKNIVLALKPEQINILGQVFRPIFSGKISELTDSYILLDKVNMKISSAPEFIFPTSLTIPLNQIALFFEYPADKRFPLH